jgi:DNA primase
LSVTRDQIRSLLDDEIPYIQSDDTKAELRLPMEYQPIWKPTTSIKWRHAVTYLRNRNITAHDILRYEIGFCEAGRYADRIIIPSFDAAGKLNYFTSRAFFDGMQSYLNPPISRNIVGFENQINWNYPVTLVEGAFDAMAVKQNAIPMFGKILTKRLIETLIDKKVSLVNLALDADALKDVLTGAETLMHHGIAVNYVHLGGKDPSSLGYEEVRNAIKNARLLDFSTMVELKMKV